MNSWVFSNSFKAQLSTRNPSKMMNKIVTKEDTERERETDKNILTNPSKWGMLKHSPKNGKGPTKRESNSRQQQDLTETGEIYCPLSTFFTCSI